MENTNELVLTHATVIFAELQDKGFGLSITIDATESFADKDGFYSFAGWYNGDVCVSEDR